MQTVGTRTEALLIASSVLLLPAIVVFDYLGAHPFRDFLYSSDSLYLGALYQDLFHGGSVANWSTPNALFIFPDAILYGIIAFFIRSTYWQIIAYSVLQTMLLFVSLSLLCVATGYKKPLVVGAGILSILGFFALTYDGPFSLLFASVTHYGSFIAAILFVAAWLWLNRETRPRSRAAVVLLLGTLSFVAALSDDLFLVQAFAPFALLNVASIAKGRRSRSLLATLTIPIGAGIAGSYCHTCIVAMQRSAGIEVGVGITVGVHNVASNVYDIASLFGNLCTKAPPCAVVFCVYAGILAWAAWRRLRHRSSGLGHSVEWLLAFSILSSCITVMAVSFDESFPVADRYFVSTVTWPIIILAMLVYRFVEVRGFKLLSVLVLAPYGFTFIACVLRVRSNGLQGEYYSPTMACIDDAIRANGALYGIANYWDAKKIQLTSKVRGLQLAQYGDSLLPDAWETTREYFKDRYDFAVVALDMPDSFKLPVDRLNALNGPPLKITCGDRLLLFYGRGQMRVR